MELTNDAPEWSSDDSANLRTFLKSSTGGRFLARSANSAPVLFGEGDTNKILIRNGELRGYQKALQEMLLLANPPAEPAKIQDAYPDLTDDSNWEGVTGLAGEKIETPE